MKLVTIKDLYKVNKEKHQPLLGSSNELRSLPFMEEYLNFHALYDRSFSKRCGRFSPIYNINEFDDIEDILDEFREDCFTYLFLHKDAYEHLFAITELEYNPIENYNGTLHHTETHTGTDTLTKDIGEKERNESFGEDKTTIVNGERNQENDFASITNQDVMAQQKSTVNNGVRHSENENEISAFNSGSYQDQTKVTNDENASTDVTTNDAYTDSHILGSHKDTIKNNQSTDTSTRDSRIDNYKDEASQDKDTQEYNSTMTIDEEKSGNLGVTSTQDMMEQEEKFWSKFNFYERIFTDIITNLCTYQDFNHDVFEEVW